SVSSTSLATGASSISQAGGTASATARGVSTGGGDVTASAISQGGVGIIGGSISSNNTVSGATSGKLTLLQYAVGGAGFAQTVGGAGGNADSGLTYQDTQASVLNATSSATGGNSGNITSNANPPATVGNGDGGSALASINVTGSFAVNATATAVGGS